VFPVRYELDLYVLFRRNSVFKGLKNMATWSPAVTKKFWIVTDSLRQAFQKDARIY
jgi:hypothetical protein